MLDHSPRRGFRAAPRRRALVAAGFLALILVHWRVPTGFVGDASFLLGAWSAAAVAWIGARRAARSERMVPWLVALGITSSAVGDLSYRLYGWFGTVGDVSLADIPWLSSFLWLGAALMVVVGRGGPGRRLHAVLDVLVISCVSLLLMWDTSVAPIITDPGLAPFVRAVWAAYPIADAVLLALVIRALTVRSTRRTLGFGFGVGVVAWLAADFGFLFLSTAPALGVWLDLGWMLGVALMAMPTSRLTARQLPVAEDEVGSGYAGIAFALLPLLVPGGIELFGYLRGHDANPIPLIVATTVMVGLAFVRTAALLRSERMARQLTKAGRRHYERVAANSSDAVIVIDLQRRIMNESPQLASLIGCDGAGTLGVDCLHLVVPEDAEAMQAAIDRAQRSPGEVFDVEVDVMHGRGDRIILGARIVNLNDDDAVGGILISLHDITARKRAEAELSHQAFHDSLTGLANRALFGDRIAHARERNSRTGLDLAVVCLDLDGFKFVNDSLGHEAGDVVLREVSRRLLDAVRPSDTVARLGGDEFAILVEASNHAGEEASTIADRVLQALTAPIEISGQRVTVSASIGIAISDDDSTPSALLRDADIAMYRAKAQGKSRWVSYEPHMRAAAVERQQLESDLGDALEADQFRLMYQPVVELESQRVVGFEALLRWDHPTLGVVGPDKFIPIAEETGLILPIGAWVLRTACETAARWRHGFADAGLLSMAVNVSARQLETEDLVAHVAEALTSSGLDPTSLVIEMTESALVADPAVAAQRLGELRAMGVRLAIDDFGTGYSSLSYLRQFPVDILKIDRSFVSSITDRTRIPAIVRGLLDLGHTLELEIVAEGVEDDAQRDGLRDQHCEFAQGYLFARPLDVADAELLLVQMGIPVPS